jgi:hypothetical protein
LIDINDSISGSISGARGMQDNDNDDKNTINAGGGTEIPNVDDQVEDNCGTLASTAATTTTVVKATTRATVTTNKETW